MMSVPEPFKPCGWYHEDNHEIVIALNPPHYVCYEFKPFFKPDAEYVTPVDAGERNYYTLAAAPTSTAFVYHKDQPSFATRGRTPKYDKYSYPPKDVGDTRGLDARERHADDVEDPDEMLFYDLTEENSAWFKEKVIIKITL